MESVADELRRNGIGCGVALFGETIFALVDPETEQKVLDVLRGYGDAIIVRSGVDNSGARLREPRGA
jgi:pantoate kinase